MNVKRYVVIPSGTGRFDVVDTYYGKARHVAATFGLERLARHVAVRYNHRHEAWLAAMRRDVAPVAIGWTRWDDAGQPVHSAQHLYRPGVPKTLCGRGIPTEERACDDGAMGAPCRACAALAGARRKG